MWMQIMSVVMLVVLGYLIGSIPSGLIIVKLKTGKDIRKVESGRTGGTNALRAAGLGAGLLTAFFDIFKSTLVVWLAQWFSPDQQLAHALAPIAAVLGHNYSIYLPDFDENGRFVRLRGGAGGAPALGGAIGLWWPSVLIILPLGALIFFTMGYASVTTLSVAFFAILSFSIRLALGAPGANWYDIAYGVICLVLLAWALRPNLTKLLNGTERVVGISLHGRIKAKKDQREAKDALDDVA
jgi:glycerol-3-phosphate acyltransferase PlsY